MFTAEAPEETSTELSHEAIREQLESLVQDQVFRSSKRSVQFLKYVVEQTLNGSSDQIKERTIGVEVFGRVPSYDTNVDHVVRTAAIELRKRLAIYYGEERHRAELRMSLVPGSYIPKFYPPAHPGVPEPEPDAVLPISLHMETSVHESLAPSTISSPEINSTESGQAKPLWFSGPVVYVAAFLVVVLAICGFLGYRHFSATNAQEQFWKPVLDTPGAVLLAVGDVPNGPPTISNPAGNQETSLPIIQKASAPTVPFADAITIARVLVTLEAHGKKVLIRPASTSSFSDLREGPVVLVGAFNNEWSLRMTRNLRYTLALDSVNHLIYIRDTKQPNARNWSWKTDDSTQHQGEAGGSPLQDYALISRIWDSETGHVVVVIGGLYTHGTEAAGEFLADPQMLQAVGKVAPLDSAHTNLQIVLGTTITDGTPGPPRILAVSTN